MTNIATEYLAWLYVGITKIVPLIMLTAIIYYAIMRKREKVLRQQKNTTTYKRVTYPKSRAYDQDAGQYVNKLA